MFSIRILTHNMIIIIICRSFCAIWDNKGGNYVIHWIISVTQRSVLNYNLAAWKISIWGRIWLLTITKKTNTKLFCCKHSGWITFLCKWACLQQVYTLSQKPKGIVSFIFFFTQYLNLSQIKWTSILKHWQRFWNSFRSKSFYHMKML